jgi:hypothetical protein
MSWDPESVENFIVDRLRGGEWADFTESATWAPDARPVVTAQFLRNLILGLDRRVPSLPSGLRLRGVRVDGDFDLADSIAPAGSGFGVLALEDCDLPGRLTLSNIQLSRLSIRRSRFSALWGECLSVRGDLDLRETSPMPSSTEPMAYVRLRAARIGGDLWGRGANLQAPASVPHGLTTIPPALNLWLAQIEGSVNFDSGFVCSGAISLMAASVGGNLSFSGARLSNQSGVVLDASGCTVGGDADFSLSDDQCFEAEGEMRFINAAVGRDFVFLGARLSHAEGDALDARGCSVRGRVLLTSGALHRFSAVGAVSFADAKIIGDMICSGASLSADSGLALNAHSIEVGGSILLNFDGESRFEAAGEVRLLNGKIGGDMIVDGARLDNPGADALDASGCTIAGHAKLTGAAPYPFEANGAVLLSDAQITRDLVCSGAQISSQSDVALNAHSISVGGGGYFDVFGDDPFRANGEICLVNSRFGSDLVFRGARLANPGAVALNAGGCSVRGHALLTSRGQHRFEAAGALLLWNARVTGDLVCSGASLAAPGGVALNAHSIEVGGLALFKVNDGQRFEAVGEVRLIDGSIGRDLDFQGARLRNEEGDALDASGCTVGGRLSLNSETAHRFEATGTVVFADVKVRGDLTCSGALLSAASGLALNAQSIEVGGIALLNCTEEQAFEAIGEVRLVNASIAGQLNFSGARMTNKNRSALDASGCRIGGHAVLASSMPHRFEASGSVDFWKARIVGDLVIRGAVLDNPKAVCFSADDCTVGGRIAVSENAFSGSVSLVRVEANVLGHFDKSAWSGAEQIALDGIAIRQIEVDQSDLAPWKARAHWLKKSTHRNQGYQRVVSPHPWRECAVAFARSGRHLDARRIQREGYREENRARPIWIRPFVWLLAEVPFGFGLSAVRATVTLVTFWLLGTLGVVAMQQRGVLIDTSVSGALQACSGLDPALFALDIAIPIIDIQQESKCDVAVAGQQGLHPGISVSVPSHAGPSAIRLFDEISLWNWAKAIYALLGTFLVSFAGITYSGIFKPKDQ